MLAALCMTACGNDEETYSDKDDDTAIIKVGMAAPTFELKGLDDSKVTSESLKGKVYILNFFISPINVPAKFFSNGSTFSNTSL